MKSKFLILVALVGLSVMSSAAERPDPAAVLKEARDLARSGEREAALEKHLWYHENALRIDPAQVGVRLSFALSDWRKLGDDHPPALGKMRSIRNRGEKQLSDGQGDFSLFMDVVALNRVLEETDRTCQLFKTLDAASSPMARQGYVVAAPALVACGEFTLCSKYTKRPVEAVTRSRRQHEMSTQSLNHRAGQQPAKRRASFKAMMHKAADERFVEQTLQLIEILVKSGREKEAAKVVDAALEFRDKPEIRNAVAAFSAER